MIIAAIFFLSGYNILMIQKIPLIFILILLLAACTSPNGQSESPPTQTHTVTVPPLPTTTSWATKTPRPTSTPTPTPLACWSKGGTLVEDEAPSELLPDSIKVLVYLPPCYDEIPEADYPSLYLFHGQSFDQHQWVDLVITELMDKKVARGSSPLFVIVMPLIEDWAGPSENPFGQAVVEELLPYMQENYRLRLDREWRQVGGISRGASWALHIGVKYWEQFSGVGGHSLPVFYEDAYRVFNWLADILEDQLPAIYIDHADSDQSAIKRSIRSLIGQLDELGIPYQFSTAPGVHDQAYWSSRVEEYLAFYISNWQ